MLSERATKIKPSATLAMDTKAKALKAQGVDIINFGVGEPDFDTPDHIKEAAIKAIKDGFTKYTPVGGTDELKEAIIDKLKADNGLSYTKDQIVVSCGAKHSLYNIAQALFGPGDEVLIPAPYWVSYPDQVLLNDATPVFVQTAEESRFMVQAEALKAKITPRTKAIILNSPSNPTGLTYTRSALEAISEIAVANNLFVISDEVYEKLVYDGMTHISIASLGGEIKDRTIVVNGLSKAYAMTGWRIGYAAGPQSVIKAMTNIQSQSTSNPTSIAQKAAVAALRGPQDFVEMMRAAFDERRTVLVDGLNAIAPLSCLKPDGAFYAFPNVSKVIGRKLGDMTVRSSVDLAMYLLENARVALVPGDPFGDDNFIRISYATSMDNIQKALQRLRESFAQLG